MKNFRILPETCANTTCLFSSSTRNIAFLKASTTVPSTVIPSSFVATLPPRISSQRLAYLHRHAYTLQKPASAYRQNYNQMQSLFAFSGGGSLPRRGAFLCRDVPRNSPTQKYAATPSAGAYPRNAPTLCITCVKFVLNSMDSHHWVKTITFIPNIPTL